MADVSHSHVQEPDMLLPSGKSLVSVLILLLIALVAVSCAGEQRSPTSPSGASSISGINNLVEEYWVTLADEAPAPTPGPGGNTGSWPPGPPPTAAPGVPVPTPPSTHPRVSIKIDPEPVMHSGTPITDVASCRGLPHTWFYDVHIHGETGVRVSFSERENFFDGRFVSKSGPIDLAPNGTVILHVRWCSGYPRFHYTQHRLKGTDEYGEKVELSTPWVRLYAPGTN
jgi:hypothetical protein